MYDIIIRNGTLIDGSGEPMYKADIGIKDDKIYKIGELHNEMAEVEIDASERLVCPGFIDVNNHSDTYWRLFLDPQLESLAYQGITTIVGGNCGSSLAPLYDPETIASIQKWIDVKRVSVNWLKFEEFLRTIESKGLSLNFASLVGHATIRRGLIKDEVRNPNTKEVEMMKKMLASSLKEGALGMSTGLVYTHAKLATPGELVELAKVVKKHDKVYSTHVRGEKDELIASIDEALEISRNSGVKLHISHLKAMGEKNWNLMDEALGLLERASERGMDVTFDVYPYTNTGSVLYVLLPDWISEGGRKIMLARLKDPVIRAKAIAEMKNSGFDYSKVEIAISPLNKTLARKKIADIAKSQEKSIEEAIIDVLIASEGRVITSMDVLSEENIRKAISHPLSIVATNGSGYNLEHVKTGEIVHPRSFGTFPRIFAKYVMGARIIGWEEAVKKMTYLPAQKFGLKGRGLLQEKNFADIVILNRDEINDIATQQDPYNYSRGIDFVLVNGQVVVSEGRHQGLKSGRILKG